jgi:osmoprotectant transport system permease protein
MSMRHIAPPRVENPVLLVLALAGLLAVAFGGFLSVAPNRLANGVALSVWAAPPVVSGLVCLALLAFLLLAFRGGTVLHGAAGFGAALVLLAAVVFGAGAFAAREARPDMPALRLSLGAGFWGLAAIALVGALDSLQRARLSWGARAVAAGLVAAVPVAAALTHRLDALSLAREFESHRDAFAAALRQHVALVVAALGFALLIGAPLASALQRRQRLRRPVLQTLNLLQTIPSIALFGLLIAPLSALATAVPALAAVGIGGTGAAPALIALVLYALMPLVRSFDTGFREVPADAREAARGLGFTAGQRFLHVELPLALPALVSGLRIVTVQTIGLATVAALIGAGGLGGFIFQGIGQYALDLVLLGALPVILLALVADFGFQAVLALLRGVA